jgi:1-deoxy-D-xylulose-5-phosphate synthase
MCLDRAGLVGSDGKTHQGVFDLSYLRHVPNLTVLAPKCVSEFTKMLVSVANYDSPVAIRYPNGVINDVETVDEFTLDLRWETLKKGGNTVIFACGARMVNLALEVYEKTSGKVTVVNARVVKPMDELTIKSFLNYNVITLEDNVLSGGFGEGVLSVLNELNFNNKFKSFGVIDKFIEHDTVKNQMEICSLTTEEIIKTVEGF